MTPDQWTDWLNLGLPTAALIAISVAAWRVWNKAYEDFVKPIGGPDGKIAKYLDTQAEQFKRQVDVSEKHSEITRKLSVTSTEHAKESTAFYDRTDMNVIDILQCHQHVIAAMQLQFDNTEAVKELSEADAILRRHLGRL